MWQDRDTYYKLHQSLAILTKRDKKLPSSPSFSSSSGILFCIELKFVCIEYT